MRKITEVAAAVLLRPDGSFLLGQRSPGTFYPGYWEFPGGKVEAGETPRQALVRELAEELEIVVRRAHPWVVREFEYEHAHVRLHFFRVTAWEGELRDHVHAALEWQRPGETTVAPMLPANAPILKALTLPASCALTRAGQVGAERQLADLEGALGRGLRLVLLHEPALEAAHRAAFLRRAVALCRGSGARVLIDGTAEEVGAVGADGLCLPASALAVTNDRPPFPWVAAACNDPADLARAARLAVDFAVLGPMPATAGAPGPDWARLAEWLGRCPLPVYAGGPTGGDRDAALATGAQGIVATGAAWDRL